MLLLTGNGFRDYALVAASAQARWPVGKRPLTLGADWLTNVEDYDESDPDPFTVQNRDQTDGYVLLASYGKLEARADWLAAYYYAHLETFAVDNSYSQDDWARWGSATQFRLSNLKGHELRFGYAFTPNMNLITRFYAVEAITTVEDGKRMRADFNYTF
jgi:hypothetical protein